MRLQQYKPSDVPETFPRAVSAMVNIQEVIDDNTERIAKFYAAIQEGTAHPLVTELLGQSSYADDCVKMTDRVIKRSVNTSWNIHSEDQRLSPVDFGFHNALFREGRPPVILDLEYFGWDDPLHPIADFIAHDQTRGLSRDLKHRFVERYSEQMMLPQEERQRLTELIKLTDIKFIAIYLLSVTPKYLNARSFAAGSSFDTEKYIRDQVKKIEERKRLVFSTE